MSSKPTRAGSRIPNSRRLPPLPAALAAAGTVLFVLLALTLPSLWRGPLAHAGQDRPAVPDACRTAPVLRTSFKQAVQRTGSLKPVNEQRICVKVNGTIQEMAPLGKIVAKDEVVLRLDPLPHRDAKAAQEALLKQTEAEYRKAREETSKVLNQAKEDVAGYDLRVELETRRLEEIKKGPTPQDVVNAQVDLENNRILLKAREEELELLAALTAAGYASQEELRQKQLDVKEQRLNTAESEVKQRKLDIIDPVKLGEQELKVHDALKYRDAAKERVGLLERNMQRDLEHHQRQMERAKTRLRDLTENLEKTVHTAPGPGVVIHRRHRWYGLYTPGRDVWEGQEIMALPDFTKMKVVLTVDEARISQVRLGQEAEVTPAGWDGPPLKGKVSQVADKGRDEFEMFSDETTALSGTANRQVFEVEVELAAHDSMLRPGLRADVQLLIRTLENVLVVPRTALIHDKDGSLVVWVDAPHGPVRRPVQVSAESDLSAVVEGVQEGEQVWVVDPE
ncbi:MAG: HlyD family efflux transporter periplasmic adaptor subunit [Planctomycetota bacterium]